MSKWTRSILAFTLVVAFLLIPDAQSANASGYCYQYLNPEGAGLRHTHYLTISSNIDFTSLTNSRRAWIFYWNGTSWEYEDLAAWTKNTWGVHTSWVAWHPLWNVYPWAIVYPC